MNLALFDLDHTLLPLDSDHEWGEFMARIGAGSDKQDQRLNPDGTPIPGRTQEPGAAKPVLIEGAFFE